MEHKKETNQIYTGDLQHVDGPSYAEDINLVQSFYNKTKLLMPDKENRIRDILSARFQKPVEIIDEYLCVSEYIDDSVLNTLSEVKAGKHFFELAQKIKRNLVKIYRHDELSDKEIYSKISKAVLQMLSEYNEKGKINTRDWQRFNESNDGIQNKWPKSMRNKGKTFKPKPFNYWYGVKQRPKDCTLNINEINGILREVSWSLKHINFLEDSNLHRQAENIKKEILRLAKVHHHILEMHKQEALIQKWEVA